MKVTYTPENGDRFVRLGATGEELTGKLKLSSANPADPVWRIIWDSNMTSTTILQSFMRIDPVKEVWTDVNPEGFTASES